MNFQFQVAEFTIDNRFVVPWNEFLTENNKCLNNMQSSCQWKLLNTFSSVYTKDIIMLLWKLMKNLV
jgi:hypothetical protein